MGLETHFPYSDCLLGAPGEPEVPLGRGHSGWDLAECIFLEKHSSFIWL